MRSLGQQSRTCCDLGPKWPEVRTMYQNNWLFRYSAFVFFTATKVILAATLTAEINYLVDSKH